MLLSRSVSQRQDFNMATPFSNVDPLQVELEQIRGTPTVQPEAFGGVIESAVSAGQALEQQDLGRQFQALLDGGQEAMNAARKQFINDGTLTEEEILDPNMPAFQKDEEGQLKWWQDISAKIKAKEGVAKRTEIAELKEPSEIRKQAFIAGEPKAELLAKDIEATQAEDLEERAETFISRIITDVEKGGISAKKDKDLLFKELAAEGFAGTEIAKEFLSSLAPDKSLDRQKAINERQEKRLTQTRQERYIKSLEKIERPVAQLPKIDEALPNGIFGDLTAIPGIGTGKKLIREWLNTDEAVKIRIAVRQFILGVRKQDAGTAVTASEARTIEQAFGLNLRASANAFIEAMRLKVNELETQLTNRAGRLNESDKNTLRSRGVLLPEDLAAIRTKGKGSRTKKKEPVETVETVDDKTLEEMSDAEFLKALSTIGK